jgi:hypothetical protein
VAFSFIKLFIYIKLKEMAKTVYLTKEQYETLKKNFISEGENNLTMPVEIEQGDNVMDKLSAAKDNI